MKNKELAELLGIKPEKQSFCSRETEYCQQTITEGFNCTACPYWILERYPDFEKAENFVKLLGIVAQCPYTFLISGNEISIKKNSHVNIGFYESDTIAKSLIGLLLEQFKNLSTKRQIIELAKEIDWVY